MPYEKNKSAYQDDAYFERERRNRENGRGRERKSGAEITNISLHNTYTDLKY